MATFAEIMREQQGERFASAFSSHPKKSSRKKKGREGCNTDVYDFDDDLNLALLLSLSIAGVPGESATVSNAVELPSSPSVPPSTPSVSETNMTEADLDLSYQPDLLQEAEDELLAYYLQTQERNRVPNNISLLQSQKTFSPLEYDLYYQKYQTLGYNASEQEGETEYDYTEPYQLQQSPPIEPPLLYDSAQRREDKDISFVSKRVPEKRTNGVPIALHHKDFPVAKTKQKRSKKPPQPPVPSKIVPTDFSIQPPLTKTENYDYGLVLRALGARMFLVFSYNTSSDITCWLPGRLLYRNYWVDKGSIVLFKKRLYQPNKADIVCRYTPEEYQWLQQQGELKEYDPRKLLSKDILSKVMAYLDSASRTAFQDFLNSTNTNKKGLLQY